MDTGLRGTLIEICKSRQVIYDLLDGELRHLKFCCYRYHDEQSYYRYSELKKVHNLLKYVLDQCDCSEKN